MRRGEKLIKAVGEMLSEKYGDMVFPENIYDYIQNELDDEDFNCIIFDAPDGDYIDGYKIGAGT